MDVIAELRRAMRLDKCLGCDAPPRGSPFSGNPSQWFCSDKCQLRWVEENHPEWLAREGA